MLQLKAEELFFLGKFMNAQFIDYDYVRLMDDIQQNYKQNEKSIMAKLVDQDILTEDFSGNMELDEDVEELMRPIFFGTFESFAGRYYIDEEKSEEYRFHFSIEEKLTTAVKQEDKTLLICDNAEEEIDKFFATLCPEEYEVESKEVSLEEIDQDSVTEILILRNIQMGEGDQIRQIFKMNRDWYLAEDEENFRRLSWKGFKELWDEIIKGE